MQVLINIKRERYLALLFAIIVFSPIDGPNIIWILHCITSEYPSEPNPWCSVVLEILTSPYGLQTMYVLQSLFFQECIRELQEHLAFPLLSCFLCSVNTVSLFYSVTWKQHSFNFVAIFWLHITSFTGCFGGQASKLLSFESFKYYKFIYNRFYIIKSSIFCNFICFY